jgi:predicted nuclease with TOPRIM domain
MNILKPPKQPQASQSPPSVPLPRIVPRPPTNQLHEDALRFGQQIVDLQATASRLHTELEDMTARAKLAEEEVRRLEARVVYMEKAFEQRETQLSDDRDKWKMLYGDVEKSLQLAGGIILDIVRKSETRRASHVNISSALADAIEPPSAPVDHDKLDKVLREEVEKLTNPSQ